MHVKAIIIMFNNLKINLKQIILFDAIIKITP